MTRKYRRILLFIAFVAFLAIGFFVLMYARGYRWDFNKHKLLLSGAIYIKPQKPDTTNIFVNEKNTDEQTAALIKNLLPLRKYKTKVAKDGYQAWAKELDITPGLVAAAENIILFPEKLTTQIIWPEPSINNFSISPNQKLIAAQLNQNKVIIKDITDLNASAISLTFADKRKTNTIGLLKNNKSWSANSQKLIFRRDAGALGRQPAKTFWYVWNSQDKSLVDITSLYEKKIVVKQASSLPLPIKFTPTKVAWFDNDNNLLVIINGQMFDLDIQNESVTDLKLNDIVDFDSFENKIIALKNPDILMLLDSAVQNVSALGQTKFVPQKVLISPDYSKVMYANANTIGIFWLKDTAKQPLKKAGDQEIIYQTQSNIGDVYWQHYNEHLIFLENQNLKTAELDTRDKVNVSFWPETILAIDYLPQDSKLFILENGAIKSVDGEF